MATADEYAAWIVANASKRGTPEFETVAKAYELAKSETATQEPQPQGRPIASFERGPSPEDLAAAKAAGQPETTAAGVGGAVTRGIAPAAVMAGAGALGAAALGAPVATGAALGGAALGAAKLLGVDQPFVEKLNELMTRAGVAEPRTTIERLIQSATGSTADVATGIGAGRALQGAAAPVARAAGAFLAEQPVAQLAAGAGSGAAAQAAQELGLGYGGQLVASIIGGAAGSRLARTGVVPAAQAQAAERALVAEGERVGVPVLTSDVAPPRTFMGKAAQAAGERVPFVGTGPVREAQQAARVQAVKDIASEYGATTAAAASEAVMQDLQKTRQGRVNALTRAKTDVIEGLAQQGAMPVTRATAAIDQQIQKLEALKTKELRPAIDRLQDWRQSIQGQDIASIETLRKQLGESFKAPELASVRTTAEKSLSSIYGALRDDMGAFIKTAGQPKDFDKWQVANKELSSMMRELDKTALKATLDKGTETPEVVARLLFSEKPSDVRLLYRNLSDDGKKAAQTAVLSRAVEKATTGDVVSPEKFVTQVDKLGKQIGVFFKGDELQRVKGLERVLRATRRAGEAGVSTATGQQVVPAATALAAGQVTGSALGGAAALGSVGLAARLYESAPVRNLLLRLPATKVGSPEEAAILKRITNAMQARTTTEER